jgi:hypothetical protein
LGQVTSPGPIVGWGKNNSGQIDVPAGNDFVAIAAGDAYSLALKSDGSIVGWGRDDYGQATPPDGTDFVAIAGGHSHSLTLKSDGSIVGIGQGDTGPHKLYVNGTGYATGGFWVSDLRFKKNIKTIDSPIDKINNIRGVSFEWKRSEYQDKGFPEGEHYGVIAQEIEQVLPEIVKEGPDGNKAVSYTELVPILTEAIKEQQKQLEEQQKRLEEQQIQVEYLFQKVEWLERIVQQQFAAAR